MGRTLTIEVPPLPNATHPNRRSGGWQALAGGRKKQRLQARAAASSAIRRGGIDWKPCARAIIRADVKSTQNSDSDNLTAWLKSTIDGLIDAGILIDDDMTTVVPRCVIVSRKTWRSVVLVVESLDEIQANSGPAQ